jgi:hypothetical protein
LPQIRCVLHLPILQCHANSLSFCIHNLGYDVEGVINEIKEALERETAAERAVGWDVIFFPSPAFKRMLLVGIGTAVAQQLVGIDAIQYFLMFIIEEAGIDERVWQSILLIALGVLKLVVIVFAGSLFDTKGRRPLFFWSLIGESKGIMNNICLIELKAFYCFLKVWQFLLL